MLPKCREAIRCVAPLQEQANRLRATMLGDYLVEPRWVVANLPLEALSTGQHVAMKCLLCSIWHFGQPKPAG